MIKFRKYEPRPIRFAELWCFKEWRIKIYTIIEAESDWNEEFKTIAKMIAEKEISNNSTSNHKIGFVTIHVAKMFNQIILDWWANENELRHHVFKSTASEPTIFNNITSSGEAFCVWELKIIEHERKAWIENVLKKNNKPDFNRYFESIINIIE